MEQIKYGIVLGNCACGKTSFVNRYCNYNFLDTENPTISMDIKFISDNNNKTIIYDVSGNDVFYPLYKNLIHKLDFAIILFSFNSIESFMSIYKFYKIVNNKNITKILVGNKIDLDLNNITDNMISLFCEKYNVSFFKVDSKKNIGIDQIREYFRDNIFVKDFNKYFYPDESDKSSDSDDSYNFYNCCIGNN